MQLHLESPQSAFVLRGADGHHALVNDRELHASFIITPDTLIEDWPVTDITALDPAQLEVVFSLSPELIVLGCGQVQAFASAHVQAACLSRGIGLECMTNAAAARTFNVLAAEGRRVAAALLIDG